MTQQPPEDFHAGLAATEAKNQSARVHRKRPFRCEWIRRGSELYGRSRGRQKKGNAVLRRRPSGSARRPSEPSITGARWQPPSPPCPGSPSSSSPTSPRSRCLSAPISLPSVMLREEFYSCCQLIVRARALNTCTHARTFATTATTHTGMSALG